MCNRQSEIDKKKSTQRKGLLLLQSILNNKSQPCFEGIISKIANTITHFLNMQHIAMPAISLR